ncbi:ArsR/SmtB family transcription factor [Pendulispora albinea]|uniref:Metalloregulator ArsR/SmtB family transcription factor n=1 Tax=Pendulispora albinea TaxID=2741071 RepID=A0ABZ2M466_9BACT
MNEQRADSRGAHGAHHPHDAHNAHNATDLRLTSSVAVFAALGDPLRMRIVGRLCSDGPLSITHLTSGSGVTRQAVTKHLQVLADSGLVRSLRDGRERIWELEPQKLEQAQKDLERISKRWDEALGRLKAFVETVSRDTGQGTRR